MKPTFIRIIFIFLTATINLIAATEAMAISYEDVTMTVGETKTLYLPSSLTASKQLRNVRFYALSPAYADVLSHTNFSVRVSAQKSISTPVIVRCDYTYYILRNGKYVYGGSGAFDFRIRVKDIQVRDISLPATTTVYVGEGEYLVPTIYPSNATNGLSWSSSDYPTINVSQQGYILAQHTGSAVITVTADNGVSASCTVTAIRRTINVRSVTVSPSTVAINEGESITLSATVLPSDATDRQVTWYSANPDIVTVDRYGRITGKREGKTVITAESSNGIKGSCSVECKPIIQDLHISDKEGLSAFPAKANITYERVFHHGWNSVCLPFELSVELLNSFGAGFRIAVVERIETEGKDKKLCIRETVKVRAGAACLVHASEEITCSFKLNNVTLAQTPDDSSLMKGTYTRDTIGTGMYKLTADGTSFGITKDANAISAPFRAYIHLNDEIATKSLNQNIEINF